MLELVNLSVSLDGVTLLDGVSARVPEGGWFGLVGANGAGKTTLLRAVAGLLPYRGTVQLVGRERGLHKQRDAARLVAYVPQRPVLPPAMLVTDYVLLGRSPHHSLLGAETARDRRIVAAVLERLGLAAFSGRPLAQLSGGESQRVVLARALAQEAPLLAMDEPTASLDLGHGQLVLELVDEMRREGRLTILSALHDLTLASQYADSLLVLAGGRLVANGPAGEVLTEESVREYFGASVEILRGRGGPVVSPVRPAGAPEPPPPAASEPPEEKPEPAGSPTPIDALARR